MFIIYALVQVHFIVGKNGFVIACFDQIFKLLRINLKIKYFNYLNLFLSDD